MSSSPVSLNGVVALGKKGQESFNKNNFTKSAEHYAHAAAQAEQLTGSKDNLVSAFVKTFRTAAAMHLLQSMPSADRASIHKKVHAEMVAAIASLQRRKAAVTLLQATELEISFFKAYAPNLGSFNSLVSGPEALPGFVTFVANASDAHQFAAAGATQQDHAARMTSAEAKHLFDFVADALDLIGQTVAPDGSPLLFVGPAEAPVVSAFHCETILIETIPQHEHSHPFVRETHPEAMRRFDEAWRRLSAGPVLRVRKFAERMRDSAAESEWARACRVEDLQRRVLRRCHLPTCGKEEVHPSQFKHCSGCNAAAVAYCCREHQVADWPSHKAACKVARKGKGGDGKQGGTAGKKNDKLSGDDGGRGGKGGGSSAGAAARAL